MKLIAFTKHTHFKPFVGALLTAVVGIALWALPILEGWTFASYDSLSRFSTRPVTNRLAIATGGVAIVFMDNKSFAATGQFRTNGWDRARHAKILDRLAADGCPLVVFDVFFGTPGDRNPGELAATRALLDSITRLSNVVLMAEQSNRIDTIDSTQPAVYSVHPVLPLEMFLQATRSNWGVGSVSRGSNEAEVVRRHWRFPSPGIYDSLAWTTAKLAGARLRDEPEERWIRYYEPVSGSYKPGDAWKSLSYVDAALQPTNYFRDKIVFIGSKPKDNSTNAEKDKFSTPFTARTGIRVGGVEILATEFLNLVNHEWLRRPQPWIEVLVLALSGAALAFGFQCRGPGTACLLAVGAAFMAWVGGTCLSHFTNYWFPWLIVVGAQVPLALSIALWHRRTAVVHVFVSWYHRFVNSPKPTDVIPPPEKFDPPDYELIRPPFGEGAYGKVWLARTAVHQWQAVKAIFRAEFKGDASPYEREFHGLQLYQRIAHNHPGLLRIHFVSRMKPEGYFYYAMELGDPVSPGWEQDPKTYKPLDLAAQCAANNGRLAAGECVRIGAKLCDALQYLHSQGLAHRDIKPRNIIFVNGQPKLADVGLVTDLGEDRSFVGTEGYIPPEGPGMPQADIYALGMVLYVISTGERPKAFPELSTTLLDRNRHPEFSALNLIIIKACQPQRADRYATVTELHAALLNVDAELARQQPPR